MIKKISFFSFLFVFLFCLSMPVLALDFKKAILSPSTLLKIKPIVETESDRVIATSTVIESEETPAENEPLVDDFESDTAGKMFIDTNSEGEWEEAGVKEVPREESDNSVDSLPSSSSQTKPVQVEASVEDKPVFLEQEESVKIEEVKKESIADIDFSNVDVGAVLDICNIGPSCSGDVGRTHWLKEANVNPDGMNLGLRFSMNRKDLKSGILQVSYSSFANNENPEIVYSQGIMTGESVFNFNVLAESGAGQLNVGTLLVDKMPKVKALEKPVEFSSSEKSFTKKFVAKIKNIFFSPFRWAKNLIFKPAPELSVSQKDFLSSLKIKHDTYYLRVVPTSNGKVVGRASNEIKVKLNEASDDEITLYAPAKLFEVKIKDFKPIRGPEPGVCNGALILDTDWVIGNQLIKHAGDVVCPAPYMGEGEESWYESLWNTIKSGVDWVSAAYNSLKSSLVDAVAGLACGGDDTCRMAISAGLDIGMAAMGVPPSIPNFDELVDGGFDYLASEISTQAGCPDTVCKQMIKDNLRNILEENKNTNPNCKGEEEAHNMGIEPLCLPANVKGHLDPRGTYRGAQVTLEVKRNNLDGSSMMGAPYKLYFNNLAYNASVVGSKITNIEPYGESVDITEPLQGKMFESKTIIIPEMQKGEIFNIPIVLTPEEYWVPGHKEAMHGWSTVVYKDGWPQYQYDDWWKLYYSGTLIFGASIDGCENSYGQESCIVSTDSLTVTLPNTLNP